MSSTNKTTPTQPSCEGNSDQRNSTIISDESSEDPVASHLLAFLKKLKIHKLFRELITDPRSGVCKYNLSSLLITALFTVQFLNESKNSFQSQAHRTPEIKKKVSRFIGRDDGALPVVKTVDDVLEKIDFEEFNDVLMQLFENIRLSKLFFEHDELIPGGEYHIAFDGEKIHKYTPESDHDCESCPYCLKRTRGDSTWYCHMILVASLVCPGGFKLPLYMHPIRAQSVCGKEIASDDIHKQECELSAFKVMIPILRERFPKLKMCALLDSLYANGPAIDLLNQYKFSYAIVRKKGSMSSVGADCDGLLELAEYERSHTVRQNYTQPNGAKNIKKLLILMTLNIKRRNLTFLGLTKSSPPSKVKKRLFTGNG